MADGFVYHLDMKSVLTTLSTVFLSCFLATSVNAAVISDEVRVEVVTADAVHVAGGLTTVDGASYSLAPQVVSHPANCPTDYYAVLDDGGGVPTVVTTCGSIPPATLTGVCEGRGGGSFRDDRLLYARVGGEILDFVRPGGICERTLVHVGKAVGAGAEHVVFLPLDHHDRVVEIRVVGTFDIASLAWGYLNAGVFWQVDQAGPGPGSPTARLGSTRPWWGTGTGSRATLDLTLARAPAIRVENLSQSTGAIHWVEVTYFRRD